MTKKESLSKEEYIQLVEFIGEATLKNSTFPSFKIGVNNVTVQELVNSRSAESLRGFGKQINKMINDHDPEFTTTEILKVGGFDATELVKIVKLIIKYVEYKEWKDKSTSELSDLRKEMESLRTPEERKSQLAEKIKALEEA